MSTCKTLQKHINKYGNVRIIDDVPAGLRHVAGLRLGPLCRKLEVPFAPALVGFNFSKWRSSPVFDGVVVPTRSAAKVEAAKTERDARSAAYKAAALRRRLKKKEERMKIRAAAVDEFKDALLALYPRLSLPDLALPAGPASLPVPTGLSGVVADAEVCARSAAAVDMQSSSVSTSVSAAH